MFAKAEVVDDIAILPEVDQELFKMFERMVKKAPKVGHVIEEGFPVSNQFLFNLASSKVWVPTPHMEVLVDFVAQKQKHALRAALSTFGELWIVDHLQGKHQSYKAARDKKRFRLDDKLQSFVQRPGAV